jgi:hypothetical protein
VRLLVTSPDARTRVQVRPPGGRPATIDVPSGRTVFVNLRAVVGARGTGAGPVEIIPEPNHPVYVMRILYAVGAHGPLLAEEAPTVLPAPTRLPAVVPDMRVAVP